MATLNNGVRLVSLPVVMIGPVNAGKSTITPLLAERLNVSHVSLDDVCWGYFAEAGYDEAIARSAFERGGQAGALEYMVQFYPDAIGRILAEYPQRVIELGAGHTVYDDPELRARARQVLAPHSNVVLLLPSSDVDTSLRVLNARESNPHPEIVAMNERFVRNPSNRELATIMVYTEGKTPDESCTDILSRLT